MANCLRRAITRGLPALGVVLLLAPCAAPQRAPVGNTLTPTPPLRGVTTDDYNQRLMELEHRMNSAESPNVEDYRIGPQDLLEISVFQAPELSPTVRVSASGEISLPLLGAVHTAGLTTRMLEVVLEELLRRSYMKDPHVSVFVKEMQSHAVSVFGAVKKPGVFQIGSAKTLVEVLSMAEGLAEDAGDTVIVMRGAALSGGVLGASHDDSAQAPASSETVGTDAKTNEQTNAVETNLKNLLESGDPRSNVIVFPGDVVKVGRAGVVYVEGEVKRPGGFMLKTNENITVLQAVAMAEGLTRTAAKNHARIMRTDEVSKTRTEIPINLNQILAGSGTDPILRPNDIVLIPNSSAKSVLYGSSQGIVAVVGSAAVYRQW